MERDLKDKMNGFIQSDDFQFLKKVGERTYDVIEISQLPDKTPRYAIGGMLIDLDDYVNEDNFADRYLQCFGYNSIAQVEEEYGEQADQILAEFISETDNLTEVDHVYKNTLQDVGIHLLKEYGITSNFIEKWGEGIKKRPVDRTKNSNIKCEHCKHRCVTLSEIMITQYRCGLTNEPKHYWNRCKQFEWDD